MLRPLTSSQHTSPTTNPSEFDLTHIRHAISQAKIGSSEQGIPIGAALVHADGIVLGVGRNRRVQLGSAIRHGETDCLENVGRLPPSMYKGCTMYTTLSPCTMCAGAIILYGIKRVVIGENSTFLGGEDILRSRDVEVVNLDLRECKELMDAFIRLKPEIWNEDVGEDLGP